MPDSVFQQLSALLERRNVPFEVLRHASVYTSQQAAAVRGTPLASGAKALVCKADMRMLMIVLPADRRLASKRIRKAYELRSLRFATGEEVRQLTGLEPGAIPPIGSLFNLPTWCDQRLAEQSRINFNAGDHAISISMRYADYVALEQPVLGDFAG